jgi:hypothetical protein
MPAKYKTNSGALYEIVGEEDGRQVLFKNDRFISDFWVVASHQTHKDYVHVLKEEGGISFISTLRCLRKSDREDGETDRLFYIDRNKNRFAHSSTIVKVLK